MTVDAGGRVNNGSRKRSRHRRARCAPQHTNIDINYEINKKASVVDADELPTEMSMTAPFCASSSSSSDRSPESDVAAVLREELLRESMTECAAARAVVSSLGCVSVIGRRREMEDAVRVEVGFAMGALFGDLYDFFGVYDGHGGAHVAGACKERLHGVVKGRVEAAEGLVDWGEVMAGSFVEMDADVVKTGGEAARTVGSTAVVAVIGGDVVVVANCGDSRAVMCRGGTAIALSEDHKPNRPDELKRIEAAGGRVINWNGHRILGVLATSRSIDSSEHSVVLAGTVPGHYGHFSGTQSEGQWRSNGGNWGTVPRPWKLLLQYYFTCSSSKCVDSQLYLTWSGHEISLVHHSSPP
ncbi:probable protein phosphatase 2C 8 isoform X2 [Punica granatum]|uniref:protein-serine/threonine phosphatase n=1 Tax=Punica granatum TaxID=22663 RepID=A0A6P8DE54_PUNGR|nr:probable protein phosphatase 2C 8 isoform X2 [Punica granatum]